MSGIFIKNSTNLTFLRLYYAPLYKHLWDTHILEIICIQYLIHCNSLKVIL